jgi:hypothetical protein
VRRHVGCAADAEDLTQSFFVHLLERNTLAKVSREKGRFRSFLLAALRYFRKPNHMKTTLSLSLVLILTSSLRPAPAQVTFTRVLEGDIATDTGFFWDAPGATTTGTATWTRSSPARSAPGR